MLHLFHRGNWLWFWFLFQERTLEQPVFTLLKERSSLILVCFISTLLRFLFHNWKLLRSFAFGIFSSKIIHDFSFECFIKSLWRSNFHILHFRKCFHFLILSRCVVSVKFFRRLFKIKSFHNELSTLINPPGLINLESTLRFLPFLFPLIPGPPIRSERLAGDSGRLTSRGSGRRFLPRVAYLALSLLEGCYGVGFLPSHVYYVTACFWTLQT